MHLYIMKRSSIIPLLHRCGLLAGLLAISIINFFNGFERSIVVQTEGPYHPIIPSSHHHHHPQKNPLSSIPGFSLWPPFLIILVPRSISLLTGTEKGMCWTCVVAVAASRCRRSKVFCRPTRTHHKRK